MYFSACGAPKFPLRSERAFEEIARHGGPRLLWRGVHQFIYLLEPLPPQVRIARTSILRRAAFLCAMWMRRHGPAGGYLQRDLQRV